MMGYLRILKVGICVCLFIYLIFTTTAQDDFGPSTVNSLAYSPDGLQLAVGRGYSLCSDNPTNADDYDVHILDAATGQIVQKLSGHICATTQVSWSPDGTKLVGVSNDGTAIIWNVATAEIITTFGSGLGFDLGGAAWSPDGQGIASFLGTGGFIWDVNDGSFLKDLDDLNDNSEVLDVTWKPDGTQIALAKGRVNRATGLSEYRVEIWDVTSADTSGVLLKKLDVGSVLALAWSPNGDWLAAGGIDGAVRIVDPITGQISLTLPGNAGGVEAIAWSPDSNNIASGGLDGALRVWRLADRQQLGSFPFSGQLIIAIAWSPDGTQLVYGGSGLGDTLLFVSPPVGSTPTPDPSLTATPPATSTD